MWSSVFGDNRKVEHDTEWNQSYGGCGMLSVNISAGKALGLNIFISFRIEDYMPSGNDVHSINHNHNITRKFVLLVCSLFAMERVKRTTEK